MHNTLIIITGPTGIGKTALSLDVARHFQTEIISADSRQIYKELHIGTAVPDASEMNGIKHYFLQTLSIHDYYSAGKFELDVLALLKQLFTVHEVVIMTGGSMLYTDAVCKGIDELPDVDPEIRSSLIKKYETEGIESLRFELQRLDPVYFDRVDLHNPKRILHALELCLMTGKRYSDLLTQPQKKRPFKIIKIGLNTDREALYSRINNRVDRMMDLGLEEEARKVYPFRHVNALNTVGYRELFEYFDGKISREEAVKQIKAHSRKYARKQLTWFRHDPAIRWFDISMTEEVIPFLEDELNQGKIK